MAPPYHVAARPDEQKVSRPIPARSNATDDVTKPGTDEHPVLKRKAQRVGNRTQNPKQFGHIPGVAVGTSWSTRAECSTAAVHAPLVGGISGTAKEGAWSVALSGGYPEDYDAGYTFTYTGSGGRDLRGTEESPKNLRTAPQTFDQSFETAGNSALLKSSKTQRPVRVVRGYKLDSPYAPLEGYRYDGLYVVERAWMAQGSTGFKVCKYKFRRVAGQPRLDVRKERIHRQAVKGEEEQEWLKIEGTGSRVEHVSSAT